MAPVALVQTGEQASPADLSAGPEPQRKLRIGLFAESRLQPRALIEAFADIGLSDYADIVLIALDHRTAPALPWLWRVYSRIDKWFFGTQPDPSEPLDIISHLLPEQILRMPDSALGDSVLDSWVTDIEKLNLDVAFTLGRFDGNAIKRVAKHGVWRFGFGGRQGALDALDGFREVLEGAEVTASSLRVNSPSGDSVLYQSWLCTLPFSVTRNRDRLLRRAAQFPARVLKELHRSGGAAPATVMAPNYPSSAGEQATAAGMHTARSMAGVGWRVARRGMQKLFCVDQWFIGYRFGNGAPGGPPELGQFSRLMPPKDRFWADPFPIERDGRYYIFFEEFVFAEGKAHISVVEVDRGGYCSKPERVLERRYHLSYPFLMETDGALFMVPETAQNRSVELYRCVRFPDRWRLEKVLLDNVYCVDATLHQVDGRWWMFANSAASDIDIHEELHLFYADKLCGEWQPHRANPVKSDVRSARPAGRLYLRDGRLYRPAQICAPRYGTGVSVNQVLELTPETYREREVERIVAPHASGVLGVHTLNRAGDLSVVDGFVRRGRLEREVAGMFGPHRMGPAHLSEISHGPRHAD